MKAVIYARQSSGKDDYSESVEDCQLQEVGRKGKTGNYRDLSGSQFQWGNLSGWSGGDRPGG